MQNSQVEIRNVGGSWTVLKDGQLMFRGDEYHAVSVAMMLSQSNKVAIAIYSPLTLLPFLFFPDKPRENEGQEIDQSQQRLFER